MSTNVPTTRPSAYPGENYNLTGWLVQSRPPAQQRDEIVVTDQDDKVLASGPLYGAGTTSRDVTLRRQLGFERVDFWVQAPGGLRCKVVRRTVSGGMAAGSGSL